MPKCFVIQPFDTPNTKRFDEVLVPAIKSADFEAIRGDRVAGHSSNLVASTQQHIQESHVCLADITREDKPNVWYEVGYAIACNKPVIMIREENGKALPFDVSVYKTLSYTTDSTSDFVKLGKDIEETLKSLHVKFTQNPQPLPFNLSPHKPKTQLNDIELMILLLMMNGDIDTLSPVTYATIQRVLVTENGYTMLSVNLAIRELKRKGLIASFKWGGADALLITPAWDGWAKNHPDDVERLRTQSNL